MQSHDYLPSSIISDHRDQWAPIGGGLISRRVQEEDFPHTSLTHDHGSDTEHQDNELGQRVDQLESNLNGLQNLMLDCWSLLSTLTSQGICSTSITSITADGVEIPLRIPILAIIEEDEDEVGARVPEFSASGFGSTEVEAVAELKSELGTLYVELMDTPDELTGALPKRWKQGLSNLVMPNGR